MPFFVFMRLVKKLISANECHLFLSFKKSLLVGFVIHKEFGTGYSKFLYNCPRITRVFENQPFLAPNNACFLMICKALIVK